MDRNSDTNFRAPKRPLAFGRATPPAEFCPQHDSSGVEQAGARRPLGAREIQPITDRAISAIASSGRNFLASHPAITRAANDGAAKRKTRQAERDRKRSRNPKRSEYHRSYHLARHHRLREEYFAGKCCAFCGSHDSLEADHVDPTKKTSSWFWSWSVARREAELSKCRVLCRKCHIERHANERRKPIKHGTAYAYVRRKCRCRVCRDWNAARIIAYRAARKSTHLSPTPEPAP